MIKPLSPEASVILGEKVLQDVNSILEYENDIFRIILSEKKELYLLRFNLQEYIEKTDILSLISKKIEDNCKVSIATGKESINLLEKKLDLTLKNLNLYLENKEWQPNFLAAESSILIEGRYKKETSRDIYIQSPIYRTNPIAKFLFAFRKGRLPKYYIDYFNKLIHNNELQKIN